MPTKAGSGNSAVAGDDVFIDLQAIHRQFLEEANPLATRLGRIMDKYEKLYQRFNKVVTISDGYQSQLMELKVRLEITSHTDMLTGLANRRELMARLDSEKNRSDRYGAVFSVIIGDIDYFKSVNDRFGHLVGDIVLKVVAETLQSFIRVGDCCGRWGGEEFMIILPETCLDSACLVADKLLSGIRDAKIVWEGEPISVTMSFGVGVFTQCSGIDQLISQVDDALYAAKARGRNTVQIAQGQQSGNCQ